MIYADESDVTLFDERDYTRYAKMRAMRDARVYDMLQMFVTASASMMR